MHLSKIKMAGFKSFVDPVTIHLPSNLVGIVGPNGCGKSNVIDAVRWVMGESSAKQLRGDSMADVIFNGSSARKPVSAASIELVFDNSDGAIGGQYANYGEISVKREVVRDGTSNYFLNGVRCRRRDIQDLFLGTGLGPRSYAIIEQGTIARLVESKPEELRMFLEEAAGISKYKERRRETENRIQHTKENIERLNDVLEEINKQIQHLQRQARAAEKYKDLNEEKRRVEAELKALIWRGLNAELTDRERVIGERKTRLEAAVSAQRAVESELEKSRQSYDAATDGFAAVQGRFYEVGTGIARLEQALQHARELRQRQQADLQELERSWREAEGHISRDREQIAQLRASLAELEPAQLRAAEKQKRSAETLAAAEQAMQEWQARWEEFNGAAADNARAAEVGRARLEHLERQLSQLLQRREKLAEERGGLSAEALQQELAALAAAAHAAETAQQRQQAEIGEVNDLLAGVREEVQRCDRDLHALRSRLQDGRGRIASLEALQQAALGKSRAQLAEWLKQRRLEGEPRLAEVLHVAPGWERAVETVLGFHLDAVCVEELAGRERDIASLTGGSLSFVEKTAAAPQTAATLLAKVSAPALLEGLLGQVYAAEDLAAALDMRARLAAHQSVITRDGIWLGRGWLRVIREQDERAGVLAREQEIRQLRQALADTEREAAACQQHQERARRRLEELENRREELQTELNRTHREHADITARLQAGEERLQQLALRLRQLGEESEDLGRQIAALETELHSVRDNLDAALRDRQHLEVRHTQLQAERERLRLQLEQARAEANAGGEAAHEIALKLESRRSMLESTEQNLGRMQAQLAQMQNRRAELTAAIAAAEPLRAQETELSALLERRRAVEAELAEARRAVETASERVRALDQQRLAREREAEALREEVQRLQLGTQEVRVRGQTLVEQLQHDGYALEALLQDLDPQAVPAAWEQRLADLEQRINRLGPINLAAIQEYAEQAERKQYLDKQLADLNEALSILQEAIRKIDRETRTRFKETFDRVNTGLQTTFPKLFGGGHAYLELTGEELLDAGVAIMARPPGKRNSTIHLLSGGEKALTAVALVFAIFELNPAPFCLLDEVDAPLDEANIGRFCDLVRSMSDRVQFVFITHNKSTMEMANQLIGVTMNEPGVSRLVAVDVDEAVRIAAM